MPVLAQLSEEQLSRIGIRTMGERVRMMNAAQQAMVTSVGQSVNENIVEDQPEEREEQDDVGGVEGKGISFFWGMAISKFANWLGWWLICCWC